jgi:uncharacterized membrane protein
VPPAAATAADALAAPLTCFGNEPFWALELKTDGSASCSGTCEGPAGLRMSSVQKAPGGDPLALDVVAPGGSLFLSASIRHTGKCSDGMSDNLHPCEFSAHGAPGKLDGCCRPTPQQRQ